MKNKTTESTAFVNRPRRRLCQGRSALMGAVFFLLLAPSTVNAVAYCALRDPVNTIYQLYPHAKSYRSDVRTVGTDARDKVHSLLPFAMHFNELGRHTLYVALDNTRPLGFVHARSEQGEWGLTEIAWAISPELKIQGFVVQRSRDPNVRKKLTPALVKSLQGETLYTLTKRYQNISATTAPLEKTLLMSAIKTLVITDNVWSDLLIQPSLITASRQWFPTTQIAKLLAQPYDNLSRQALERLGLWTTPIFNREHLTAYRLLGANNEPLGFVFNTMLDPDRSQRWFAANDGEIKAVLETQSGQPDSDFAQVAGYAPDHARDCSNLVELAALEIATIVRQHAVQ